MSRARSGAKRLTAALAIDLDEFGKLVEDAFGDYPYLVGSALVGTQWRDVDVRLILEDGAYAAMGLGEPNDGHCNAKWRALVLAFSALGRQMTGLPVDFQIQQRTHANSLFDGRRSALGIRAQLARQGACPTPPSVSGGPRADD